MNWRGTVAVTFAAVAMLFGLSCGGATGDKPGTTSDICQCTPSEPASTDYRHDAKHVPLPAGTPQEIDVNTILAWPIPATPAFDAPRTGKELQLFHIARAFARDIRIVPGDCDLHIEISQTTAANAPRMIIEAPIDPEYCPTRRAMFSALQQRGLMLSDTQPGELQQPIAIEVTGLAFLDDPHSRGSDFVATTWELHPATVNVLAQ